MTRVEYIAKLRSNLAALSAEERDEAISYYEEFFEEAGTDNAEAVISELGSPEKLAASILSGQNSDEAAWSEKSAEAPPAVVKEEKSKAKAKPASKDDNNITMIIVIVVLVVTLPVWGGAAISLIGAVLGILLALGVAVVVLTLGGIAMAVYGAVALISGTGAGNAAFIGGGLLMLAIGLALSVPTYLLYTKAVPAMFRGLATLWKKIFPAKTVSE